jgi:hypothetical protein
MRHAKLVFGLLVLAAIGLLTACMVPIEESAEVQAEISDVDTDPASLEALESPAELEEAEDYTLDSCLTTTCRPGGAGDAYCTSLCGDVARCVSSGSGCGTRPCCVPM